MIKRVSLIATALFIAGLAYAVNSQDRTVGNNLDFQETNSIKRLKELGLKKLTSGATPPAGSVNVYAKSDGNIYKKDESGQESLLGGGEGGAGGIVINKNPGFEQSTANWTASGGTFTTTTNAADVGFGTRAGTWDASASGQTLSGDLVTVPAGLYGKICSLSFYYKGGDSNIKAQVFDGTNVIAEGSSLVANTSYSSKQVLYFTCPSSGSISARFIASGDAAPIYLDDVRLGQETLFNGKEELVGGFNINSNSFMQAGVVNTWVTYNNASFASKTFHGRGEAPSNNNYFGFKLKNIPAGDVEVCTSAVIDSLNGNVCYGAIYDGSTRAATTVADSSGATSRDTNKIGCATFSYSTPQNEREFVVQIYGTHATNCILRTNNLTTELNGMTAKLINSSNNTQAISIDKSGWIIKGQINGTAQLSTTSSPITEITDANLSMVLYPGSAPAEIPCSGTNSSSGLTCSSGNESVGVAFYPPTTGEYEACFSYFDNMHVLNGSSFATRRFYISSTPNNSQSDIEISAGIEHGVGTNGLSIWQANTICHVFMVSDTSKKTFRLKYSQGYGGSALNTSVFGGASFIIRRLVEFQDAVKFTNLVTTPRLNGLKTVFANVDTVCSTSPCTITSQSGGVDNIVRNSAGNYTVNFTAGTWTSNPYCVPTSYTGTVVGIAGIGNSTTSSFSFRGYNSSIAPTDGAFGVLCTGY